MKIKYIHQCSTTNRATPSAYKTCLLFYPPETHQHGSIINIYTHIIRSFGLEFRLEAQTEKQLILTNKRALL